MNKIEYRLAKPSDAKEIANVHWRVRDRYTQGIFLSLGKRFLQSYYKIILDDPWEVVVCAEREDGHIVGFKSVTLNASLQAEMLRKHKVRLGISALTAIIRNPRLIKGVWLRYRSLKRGDDTPKFIRTEGVRVEYWCWLPDEDSIGTVDLEKISTSVLQALRVEEVYFEVDKFNKSVFRYHQKVTKAEIVEEITLPDGRVRVLFKKKLKPINVLK